MPAPPPPPMPPPPPPSNVLKFERKLTLAGDLILRVDEIAGKSIGILGTTGSGKSTTARKLDEEFVKQKVPFTVFDIENEYASLKELGEVVLAGPGSDFGRIKLDLVLKSDKQCYGLGRRAYLEGISVVLLVGELDDDTRKLWLRSYLGGLFDAASDIDTRRTYKIIIEEVHEYVPQTGISKDDPLRVMILRVAKRGRKRGLDLIVISQRPANIDKDVLTQCQIFFAHYVTYATDIATYKSAFDNAEMDARLKSMGPGDVFFKFGKMERYTHIIEPETASPSTTPGGVHTERFVDVQRAQTLQHDVEHDEDRESMTTLPTGELRDLQERERKLLEAMESANESISALETKIAEIAQAMPTGEGMDAAAEVIALRIALAKERTRADRAEAQASALDLFAAAIRSR